MTPSIATLVFIVIIRALFVLDRDKTVRNSKALWLPTIWLLVSASRPLSQLLALVGLGSPMNFDSPDQYLDGSPIDRNFYTILLCLGLIVLIQRGKQVASILSANVPILLFFLYCAASVTWSDYSDVAFKRWIKAIADLVMVLVVVTDPGGSAAVKRFLKRPAFILIPLSVLLIKYYPDFGRVYNIWTWQWAYVGVTNGKNLLGAICAVFGAASAWRFCAAWRDLRDGRRKRTLIAHGAILIMVAWLLWMANSMTSLSCFVLASAFIVVTSFPSIAHNPRRMRILLAAMIAVAGTTLFSGLGGGALETMGRDPTLTGRTAVWDLVLSLSGSPAVGTGFESFWLGERLLRIRHLYKGLNEAHNGYLEVFLNLGWAGLLLLVFVIINGYRNIFRAYRRDPDLGRLKMGYFMIGVVYSFTEAGFRMLTPTWICFLFAILTVPDRSIPGQRISRKGAIKLEPVEEAGVMASYSTSPAGFHAAIPAPWPAADPSRTIPGLEGI